MQAIATLIHTNSTDSATSLWQMITDSCDLNGVKMPQNPHFSWMVSEHFEEEAVRQAFGVIARRTDSFEIQTNGLGLFTGEKPILYLPIVKTEPLMELHKDIWKAFFSMGVNQNTVYQPLQWIPHITVLADGLSAQRLACLLESIIPLTLEMTVAVDNLALIYSDQKDAGIKFVQEFEKEGA